MPSPSSDQRASTITTRVFAVRRKGFDPDEVRAYLGQLAEVVSRLTTERDEARGRIGTLEAAAAARPAVDEDQLTAVLGEETARVLSSARKAAAEMKQRAEENGARLLREAAAEAGATRRAADADAARQRDEAEAETAAQRAAAQSEREGAVADREAIRAKAEAEAAAQRAAAESEREGAVADREAIRAQAEAEAAVTKAQAEKAGRERHAEAEAEAEALRAATQTELEATLAAAGQEAAAIRAQGAGDRDAAQEEGREMVAEARRVRERMLADLARRRKAARAQLDQLQAARDRLLESYEGVQRTIDEATAGLHEALPAARHAAESARLRAESEPEVSVEQIEAQITAARTADSPLVTSNREAPPSAGDSIDEGVAAADGIEGAGTDAAAPDGGVGDTVAAADGVTPRADLARSGRSTGSKEREDPRTDEPAAVHAPPAESDGAMSENLAGDQLDAEPAPAEPAPAELAPAPAEPVVEAPAVDGPSVDRPTVDLSAGDELSVTASDGAEGTEPPTATTGPADPPVTERAASEVADLPTGRQEVPATTPTDAGTTDAGTTDPATTPTDAGTTDAGTTDGEATVAEEDTSGESSEPVDDLFARLRASQQASVARARIVLDAPDGAGDAEPEPSSAAAAATDDAAAAGDGAPAVPAGEKAPGRAEPTDGPADEPSDELVSLLERRDGAIEPIENRIARRLKRALADEQGRVLDGVRRSRHTPLLADVLPLEEQVAAYAAAVDEDLLAAAEEGAAFAGAALPSDASVEPVAAELARALAGVVRPRVERCFEAGEDAEDASARLRATYREWKTDRLIDATRHLVLAAFGLGHAAVTPAGALVRWVNDPSVAACPDCEDDALAGALRSGEAFPTGHVWPPAHPGCRCLVVAERVTTRA